MTREMKEHVESQYQKVEEEIISRHKQLFPSSITLDGFFWAFNMLRSRAFSHLRGQLVMLPLVDFVSQSILSYHKSIMNLSAFLSGLNQSARKFKNSIIFTCIRLTTALA